MFHDRIRYFRFRFSARQVKHARMLAARMLEPHFIFNDSSDRSDRQSLHQWLGTRANLNLIDRLTINIESATFLTEKYCATNQVRSGTWSASSSVVTLRLDKKMHEFQGQFSSELPGPSASHFHLVDE